MDWENLKLCNYFNLFRNNTFIHQVALTRRQQQNRLVFKSICPPQTMEVLHSPFQSSRFK